MLFRSPTYITINKVVANNGEGTLGIDDFPLFLDNNLVTSGGQNLVTAGTHTASETSDPNYNVSYSGACDATPAITVTVGDDVTCTITNTFNPTYITINKVVVNIDEGTLGIDNFPLFLDNNLVTSGGQNLVTAGTHTASETSDPNYNVSYSGACDTTPAITVTVGDDVTCTITNTFNPTYITIEKVVENKDRKSHV